MTSHVDSDDETCDHQSPCRSEEILCLLSIVFLIVRFAQPLIVALS